MNKPTPQTELLPPENQQTYQPLPIVAREAQPLAVRPQPTVADMLQAVVERGITNENVAALEKLTDLYERMQARDAEKAFATAFNKLQSELPTIVASSVIPNRGKYERFEDIMRQIGGVLHSNGFTVSFSMDFKENRILETCHLTHVGGFTRTNSFAVRVSGKADSETQADCKAATTAKRNALLNCLNIVIRQDCFQDDSDAGNEGDPNDFITDAQADELERRVGLRGDLINRDAFFKFARATKFSEILASRYAELDSMLSKKEAR